MFWILSCECGGQGGKYIETGATACSGGWWVVIVLESVWSLVPLNLRKISGRLWVKFYELFSSCVWVLLVWDRREFRGVFLYFFEFALRGFGIWKIWKDTGQGVEVEKLLYLNMEEMHNGVVLIKCKFYCYDCDYSAAVSLWSTVKDFRLVGWTVEYRQFNWGFWRSGGLTNFGNFWSSFFKFCTMVLWILDIRWLGGEGESMQSGNENWSCFEVLW